MGPVTASKKKSNPPENKVFWGISLDGVVAFVGIFPAATSVREIGTCVANANKNTARLQLQTSSPLFLQLFFRFATRNDSTASRLDLLRLEHNNSGLRAKHLRAAEGGNNPT